MSDIRCIYQGKSPDFPASDQHPDAKRHGPINLSNGSIVFVDAIGGEPTLDEITSMLNPADPVPQQISDRQFFQQLAISGTITQADALAAVKTGTIPVALQALINELPADQQFSAEMIISGSTIFHRDSSLTVTLGTSYGWNSRQIDAFFKAASAL